MTNLMRSPTRARTVGPGTVSPNVQALNFTPGAISMILCVVSSRTVFTGEESRGFNSAPMLSEAPSANAPLWRSELTFAGGDLSSIFDTSYGSGAAEGLHAASRQDAAIVLAVLIGASPPVGAANVRSLPRSALDPGQAGAQ